MKGRLAPKEAATASMKTRDERREKLKRTAVIPNGIDKLYAILTRDFIPFEKLPIGTLMIEAILDLSQRSFLLDRPPEQFTTGRDIPPVVALLVHDEKVVNL
jgi:hypothetical protein